MQDIVIQFDGAISALQRTQSRSDDASAVARAKCLADLQSGGIVAEMAIQHAISFDNMRAAMFTARFLENGDKQAFVDGICAIHGAIARGSLDRKESPDHSAMIVGGTFGGIG